MQKTIEIGDLIYVVQFEGNEFSFYVKAIAKNDELSDFYDDDTVAVTKSSDEVVTASPVTLYREIMKFFNEVLSVQKPHYFFFSANEAKKTSLYAKVAGVVAEKYGYNVEQTNKTFYFYKAVDK